MTAVLTAVICLAFVAVAWAALRLVPLDRSEELWRDCSPAATGPDGSAYCVIVVRIKASPVHSSAVELRIAPVANGKVSNRQFYAQYPFNELDAGRPLNIDWSQLAEQIEITAPSDGTTITYPASSYAAGR